MNTNSWDLAFSAWLKTDWTLLVPTLALFVRQRPDIHLFRCSAVLPRWAAGCFFRSLRTHYVTNSSNSLSTTNEWWQWRLHYPIIHLPCLLLRRFPVTLDRPVLTALLTGSLSFSVAFRHRHVRSQKLCMLFFLGCQKSARCFLSIGPRV